MNRNIQFIFAYTTFYEIKFGEKYYTIRQIHNLTKQRINIFRFCGQIDIN